jgi:hypothetical protein
LPAQCLDLAFIGIFLDLSILKGPKDMFHVVQSFRQFLYDSLGLLNGFGDRRRWRTLGRRLALLMRVGLTLTRRIQAPLRLLSRRRERLPA